MPIATKMKDKLEEIVEIPEGVTVTLDHGKITVKGKAGESIRNMLDPKIKISMEKGEAGSAVKFLADPCTKKEKTRIGSSVAHLKNMLKSVHDGVNYRLKICSGHFPMNVSVSGSQFIVKNFLGEKIPRVLNIRKDVKIKVEGEFVNVDGADKELVSQTAASIETLTRRVGFDRRIFQDGIYIVEKNGEKVS
nr:50S ribosomal protein L6P [uncultured archaeon]